MSRRGDNIRKRKDGDIFEFIKDKIIILELIPTNLKNNNGRIDYIHGEDTVKSLSKEEGNIF